jgi:hypothetical protein
MITGVTAGDYYFDEEASVEFPIYTDQLSHQIRDINNDGFDELVVVYKSSFYIYSFALDSVLYKDTTFSFLYYGGVLATDYDGDDIDDLLILGSHPNRSELFLQDGNFSAESQLLYTFSDHYPNYICPRATLYYGDADADGVKDIIMARLADNLIYLSQTAWEWTFEYSGDLFSVNTSSWNENWRKTGWPPSQPCAQYALFGDLQNDGNLEIVTWGLYYFESHRKIYPEGYYKHVTFTEYQFHVFDYLGEALISSRSPKEFAVIVGAINPNTPGDDIIVYKKGNSFDTTKFTPADEHAVYCLGITDDSLELLWALDVDYHMRYLYMLPSIEGTFCISTNGPEYALKSGSDGTTLGTIYGLRGGLKTDEGHFLPGPDSIIQIVQIDGNTAYLYQQTASTDIAVEDRDVLPDGYELGQNRPNPFNTSTVIEYAVPRRSFVTLSIYNILGQRINTLVSSEKTAGEYTVIWDGTDKNGEPMATGVYFYQITAGNFAATRKMVLLK